MNEIIVKNRSGWTLHEYIDIPEEKISGYPNVTGAYAMVGFNAKARNGGNKPFMGRMVSDLQLVYTF